MSRQGNISRPRCLAIANVCKSLLIASILWTILIIACTFHLGGIYQRTKLKKQQQMVVLSNIFAKVKLYENNSKVTIDNDDFNEMEEGQLQAHAVGPFRGAGRKARFFKQDRLLPLKIMFVNAGKDATEKEKSLNGNSKQLPLTNLQSEKGNKQEALLVVIVSSAAKRQDRRNGIRQTWWRKCIGKLIKCVFFTDGLGLEEGQKRRLLKEHHSFGDIRFSPTVDATIIFGERFLYHIMWANSKFNFRYLLRLDDDYFVCVDRLLNELPLRPRTNLSWGSYHCQFHGIVYMDEAWALFSKDVIEKFLAQELRSLLCHPFGDQTFSLWINATRINLTDFDDHRLHHWPPAGKLNEFFWKTNVCNKYIGIHGSYPDLMQYLWMNSDDGPKNITRMTTLNTTCPLPKIFNVDKFDGFYKHKPKLCLEKPRWISGSWEGSESQEFQ